MSEVKLDKLSILGGKWIEADKAFEVRTPEAFIKATGYVKYCLGDTNAFYRGQTRKYPTLIPQLYRVPNGAFTQDHCGNQNRKINQYIEDCKSKNVFFEGKIGEYALEPLLQHYGIKTRWLDVVDNPWIALWFSVNRIHGIGDKYWKYQPVIDSENITVKVHPDTRYSGGDKSGEVTRIVQNYSYVLMLSGGKYSEEPNSPGLSKSEGSEIVDLRRAAPSNYLRPHAQHGILMRKITSHPLPSSDIKNGGEDFSEYVKAVFKISSLDAKKWLGSGDLLSVGMLFPSPVYDDGYRRFLEIAPPCPDSLGSIAIVS